MARCPAGAAGVVGTMGGVRRSGHGEGVQGPVLELIGSATLASCLVGGSTLAARRWGHGVGGVLSAFPLIVGPVLFIAAERHGAAFAAQAAGATLLGLVALAGFALAYARSAARRGWFASVLVAWAVAAAFGVLAGRIEVGLGGGIAAAAVAITVARAALPARGPALCSHASPRWELPVRMALTALLIALLTAAADRFGSAAAGALSALPTLATVLAVFTHRRYGQAALLELLRGMVDGMTAFAIFCAIVGGLVDRTGTALAFLIATAAALVIQAATVRGHDRPAGAWST
jgi:hypothetical protein